MEGPIISVSSARDHHEIVCGAFFLDMMGDAETRPMSLTSGEYEIGIDLSEGTATVKILKTPAPMDPVVQTRLERAIWQSWNSSRVAVS